VVGAMTDRTYRVAVRIFALVFRLLGIGFDVRGIDNLPANGPAVLAGNHIGFLDFTFIGHAARQRDRRVRFMAKKSIFGLPVVGHCMRAMRHIPVDRRSGAAAYRQSLQLLDEGELIGVFPEATISRSWLLRPFKRGAAGMSVSRQVPLVPVIVWGGHRIYTVDGHRSLQRGRPVTVLLGTPLHPQVGESVEDLSARLRTSMEALLDEAIDTYPEQPRDEADRWWLPSAKGGIAPDSETAARLDREALARFGESIDV